MKKWDFYKYFETRAEALAYKRANRERKTSKIEEIYTIVSVDDNGGAVYVIVYQVGGDHIL